MRGTGRGRGWVLAVILLVLVLFTGCGGGEEAAPASPWEEGRANLFEGRYQVKGVEDGKVRGVGIYGEGSFRIIMENVPRLIIHNAESGESWKVNLPRNTYEEIHEEEALASAAFMPHMVMKAYMDIREYWNDGEFRMDTTDGRSIRATLNGPGHLPDRWWVEKGGRVLKEYVWEYRRVGEVAPANFLLPEGVEPSQGQAVLRPPCRARVSAAPWVPGTCWKKAPKPLPCG